MVSILLDIPFNVFFGFPLLTSIVDENVQGFLLPPDPLGELCDRLEGGQVQLTKDDLGTCAATCQ
jgi:hypothetical protein